MKVLSPGVDYLATTSLDPNATHQLTGIDMQLYTPEVHNLKFMPSTTGDAMNVSGSLASLDPLASAPRMEPLTDARHHAFGMPSA